MVHACEGFEGHDLTVTKRAIKIRTENRGNACSRERTNRRTLVVPLPRAQSGSLSYISRAGTRSARTTERNLRVLVA